MASVHLGRWLGLAAMIVLLIGGAYLWSRPSSHPGAAFAAPAEAGRPIPAGEVSAPAPLIAPVSAVTAADREARRFNRYDKDRDGQVTREEYLVARRKAFAKLDLDHDSKLSFDEYSAKVITKFATADAGKDGKLSATEFATTAVKHRPKPAAVNCPPVEREGSREDEG